MIIRDITLFPGVIVATAIVGLWCVVLAFLLGSEVWATHPLIISIEILSQTFLSTGLFITAHEAMHGLVCPQHLKLNHGFGQVALWLYGFFPYQKLLQKHWLHHRYPATPQDPDFHNGRDCHWLQWYFHFLKGYWNWQQFLSYLTVMLTVGFVCHLSPLNLTLFWGFPLILSSFQLFYFGTFLPHRQPKEGYENSHRANSVNLPVILSFFCCYHFGYHREHHENPTLPWWQLPRYRVSS